MKGAGAKAVGKRSGRHLESRPKKGPRGSLRGRTVTATEAARSFSSLLDRVEHRGEAFVVERGGAPVCEIRPIGAAHFHLSDLAAFLSAAATPDAEYWELLERLARDQAVIAPSPWER